MIAVNRQINAQSGQVTAKPIETRADRTIGAEKDKPTLTAEEFGEAVEKHRQELARRSARLLQRMGVPDAENVADELLSVFVVKLLGGLNKYDPARPFMGFAWTAMRNRCISFVRRNRRGPSSLDGKIAFEEIVGSDPARDDWAKAVKQAVDELPLADREIISMRIHDNLSFRVIADKLGVSTASAIRRYGRTLAKLASLLADWREDFGRTGNCRGL